MADINSFQNAGSFNTQTAPGAGYNTPGSNFQNPDWQAFFDQAAARKAEQLAYDRKRQGEQDQRQRDQDRMMAQDRHLAQKERERAVNQNQQDRDEFNKHKFDQPASAQRWMKYLPGLGPVEVAEGTFGAYAAGNVRAPQDEREKAIKLTPGAIGQNLGYMQAGQTTGGYQAPPTLPGRFGTQLDTGKIGGTSVGNGGQQLS